jgi:PiT family inorganic phosphate transporter
LATGLLIFLIICLALAFAFEFVNGFHDTANAVATVIYTNSLKPVPAVVWSGIWNALGVFTGGIGVAMGIISLLPVEMLIDQNVWHSIAMVLALLLTAIIWNLGTWYMGIPASSSHTLIGSIIGVGLAFSFLPESEGISVNLTKAGETGLSLLFSPLFGFSLTVAIMFILRTILKKKHPIFQEPLASQKPPLWIRAILVFTCTSVSFFHGQNDGQKGVGLVMLILISIIPAKYALDNRLGVDQLVIQAQQTTVLLERIDIHRLTSAEVAELFKVKKDLSGIAEITSHTSTLDSLNEKNHLNLRADILKIDKKMRKLIETGNLSLTQKELTTLDSHLKSLKAYTDYAPSWVIVMIAISLGLGTMVGWKRIVITIGEKIGKQHLTYAQGASAELVAASTIAAVTFLKLPVSTTHVLSSGIAGSMVANKGLKNLQAGTIRTIAMAWLLTLPVCIVLSGLLFLFFRMIL